MRRGLSVAVVTVLAAAAPAHATTAADRLCSEVLRVVRLPSGERATCAVADALASSERAPADLRRREPKGVAALGSHEPIAGVIRLRDSGATYLAPFVRVAGRAVVVGEPIPLVGSADDSTRLALPFARDRVTLSDRLLVLFSADRTGEWLVLGLTRPSRATHLGPSDLYEIYRIENGTPHKVDERATTDASEPGESGGVSCGFSKDAAGAPIIEQSRHHEVNGIAGPVVSTRSIWNGRRFVETAVTH